MIREWGGNASVLPNGRALSPLSAAEMKPGFEQKHAKGMKGSEYGRNIRGRKIIHPAPPVGKGRGWRMENGAGEAESIF